MIAFFYETQFKLKPISVWKNWLKTTIHQEGYKVGDINYIFCDDEYILQINREYLNHDYYTDVIGFQYSEDKELSGDIYISVERIKENAELNKVEFKNELARVMVHGILHFMKYEDETEEQAKKMREKENEYLNNIIPLI